MAWVRRRLNRVELRLDRRERDILLRIVDELRPGLGDDPRTRLHAYDDPGLDQEYQRYSRPDDGWEERSDASMLESDEYAMLVTLGWVQENVVAALGG
jgi:hypothetical protein